MKYIAICILLFSNVAYSLNIYPITMDVNDIYDGDTAMKTKVSLPFGFVKTVTIRLYGIDAPEVTGKTKEEGKKVRDWLRKAVFRCPELQVTLHGADSFGRELAILYCGTNSINLYMLENNKVKAFVK